jgi:histidinol-phosphate aminotransferase
MMWVLQVLELPVLVVLDEAYIEFCTDLQSRIKWVNKYNNLVVLRTFSKCAALAGWLIGNGCWHLQYLSQHGPCFFQQSSATLVDEV